MITLSATVITIYICCVIGLLWAFANYLQVKNINLVESSGGDYQTLTDDSGRNKVETMLAIGEYIARVSYPLFYDFVH